MPTRSLLNALVATVAAVSPVAALTPNGAWLANRPAAARVASNKPSSAIKAFNLSVPIDHFHNDTRYEPHSTDSFNLRYWVDTTHYREGGPVIVLSSGEFPSEERLPYLEHGIVPILAKATGGVGVVLEHRYYGTSFPMDQLTTHDLRFLTTEQALADTAYWSQHVEFEGLEHVNLTAEHAPHILYGGSYAGGFVAFARKLYPDVFWGAISSSGVTFVIDDFWQYYEAMRHFGPGDCSPMIQHLTHIVDSMLLSGDKEKEDEIKSLFGLKGLENDEFGSVLQNSLPSLQNTNWDPEVDSVDLGLFCGAIMSDLDLFASTSHLAVRAYAAVFHAGYTDIAEKLAVSLLNYIAIVRDNVKKRKAECKDKSLRECLSARFQTFETEIGDDRWMRSWLYQTCTEWGYFTNGASTPKDQKAMISRAVTKEYTSLFCSQHFNITTRPDVDRINWMGGFEMSYPRLALIDGRQDPWRAAGVHAIGQPDRKSTTSEPFMLVDWGVHHWEENGPDGDPEPGLPPRQVVEAQNTEVEFVKAWLEEWKDRSKAKAEEMEL